MIKKNIHWRGQDSSHITWESNNPKAKINEKNIEV